MISPVPVVLYHFNRDQCVQNAFLDSSQKNLLGTFSTSLSQYTCPPSNGAQFHYQSSRNISLLQRDLPGNISIELWFRPSSTIVSEVLMELQNVNTMRGCNIKISIFSSNNQFELRLQNCFGVARYPMAFNSIPFTIQSEHGRPLLTQAVFTIAALNLAGNSGQQITTTLYVNGRGIDQFLNGESSNSFSTVYWDPGATLHVYPNRESAANINMTNAAPIHKLAWYSKELSAVDVSTLYHQGVANSLPTAFNATVSVLQNGVATATNPDLAYYSIPVPNRDLPVVSLVAYDLDDDPVLGPFSTSSPEGRMQVLVGAPTLGSLYFLNGTALSMGTTALVPFDTATQSYGLRYRPPWDGCSTSVSGVLTVIPFSTIDSKTGARGGTGSTGIIVQRVSKPPRVTAQALWAVSRRTTTLNLTGEAQDGSSTQKLFIHQLPSFGKLFVQWTASLTLTEVTASMLDQLVVDQTLARVQYLFTAHEVMPNRSDPEVGRDSISFAVIDMVGKVSLATAVPILVRTAISASSSTIKWVSSQGNDQTLFHVQGTDASDTITDARLLTIQVLRPPAHGNVTVLPNLTLIYTASRLYFNIPVRTWTGAPIAHVIEEVQLCVATAERRSSVAMSRAISVLNVNDPTDLSIHANASITVLPTGPSGGAPAVLTWSGIEVVDPDLDADPVLVQIISSSLGAVVSLNATALTLHQRWVQFSTTGLLPCDVCTGDGADSGLMIFVTTPSILQELLRGLTFKSTQAESTVTVTIRVHDGVDGDCLSKAAMSFVNSGTIHRGCHTSQLALKVQVGAATKSLSTTVDSSSMTQFLNMQYAGAAMLVLVILLIIRCCFCGRRRQPQSLPEEETRRGRGKRARAARDERDLEWGGHDYEPVGLRTPPRGSADRCQAATPGTGQMTPPSSSKRAQRDRQQDGPGEAQQEHEWRGQSVLIDSPTTTTPRKRPKPLMIDPRPVQKDEAAPIRSARTRKGRALSVSDSPEEEATMALAADTPKVRSRKVDIWSDDNPKSVWSAHRHSSGKVYYYNSKTQKSTWKRPPEL